MSTLNKQNLIIFTCGIVLGSWIHQLIISRRRTSQLERIERALERLNEIVRTTIVQSKSIPVLECTAGNRNETNIRAQSPVNEQFYDTHDSFTFEQIDSANSGSRLNYEQLDIRLDDPDTDFAELEYELSTFVKQYSSDADFWWRYAKAKYMFAKSDYFAGNIEARKKKFEDSQICAQQALELDQNNANAHKWAAITVGSLADYVGIRERISNGLAFHRHLEAAMERKKDDPTLYHLSGRFVVQIVALSWIERKLVNTFVDDLPPVDNKQAIQYFYDAYKLKPKWKENLLYLGQTLLTDNRRDEARQILKEGIALDPGPSVEEKQVHTKLVALYNTL